MHPVSTILQHAGTQTNSHEGDINCKAFWSKEKRYGEQDQDYVHPSAGHTAESTEQRYHLPRGQFVVNLITECR